MGAYGNIEIQVAIPIVVTKREAMPIRGIFEDVPLIPQVAWMSVNVLPALFRYTNGPCDRNSPCVGTIRSRKPSLLMSPQIGLPHECFSFLIKPTSLVTSWNCWATAADERTVSNPAAVARHENGFLMPNGARRKFQRAALIKDANRECSQMGFAMQSGPWDRKMQNWRACGFHRLELREFCGDFITLVVEGAAALDRCGGCDAGIRGFRAREIVGGVATACGQHFAAQQQRRRVVGVIRIDAARKGSISRRGSLFPARENLAPLRTAGDQHLADWQNVIVWIQQQY